jgi:hypothetical protein
VIAADPMAGWRRARRDRSASPRTRPGQRLPLCDQTAQVLDTRWGGTLDDDRRIPLGQAVAWNAYLTPRTGASVLVGPDGVIQATQPMVRSASTNGAIEPT